jgi:DNA-binding response OmpR family regulator
MKVLIVDDEDLIRNIIKDYCLNEGFSICEACDGVSAIEMVKNNSDIDIIVLDIMMPNMDGYTAYQEIKKIRNIPTIILSARGEEYDKLMGFDLGVDDYLTKPFSPRELIARIKAILKRDNKVVDTYEYKELKIDKKAHSVYIKNEEIELTPKEYELLLYFIENKSIALSREQLLGKIWGYDFFGDDRTVDTHIKTLRSRLGDYRDLIKTVRGVGYKFEEK